MNASRFGTSRVPIPSRLHVSALSRWVYSANLRTSLLVTSQHPQGIVKVFVALLTATCAEFGYDPRITILSDKNFLYEMPTGREQTSAPDYAGSGTRCSTGRASRILKVVEVFSKTNALPKSDDEYILEDA